MDKIVRLNIENDYEEIFRLSQYAFQYKLEKDEVINKIEDAKSHIIYGYEEKGSLMSKLHLIPLQCNINGKKFNVGGLSSIASWPEYRRSGLVRNLIKKSLLTMKENKQLVSYLHPFSIPFYRKYGWEQVFSYRTARLPIQAFQIENIGKGYIRREINIQDLKKLYDEYIMKYSGNVVRTDNWWKYRVLPKFINCVIAYNYSDEPIGYLSYEIKDNTLDIKELVYINNNGRNLLFSFIKNHDSMIDSVNIKTEHDDYLIENLFDPPSVEEIHHHFMARIVDVESFLKNYPFQGKDDMTEVVLKVQDDFFEENSGMYKLRLINDQMSVTRSNLIKKYDIKCSVQNLSLMLIGNISPLKLFNNNKIKGNDESIECFTHWLKKAQKYTPYLMDTF